MVRQVWAFAVVELQLKKFVVPLVDPEEQYRTAASLTPLIQWKISFIAMIGVHTGCFWILIILTM